MGCSPFGSRYSTSNKDIEPKSDLFEIIWIKEIGDYTMTKILYPNCENFGGYKILVFHKISKEQLQCERLLDPHFSTSKISPIARFKPTFEGVELARLFCESMK